MMKSFFVLITALVVSNSNAQIISGPMLGHIETSMAKIWVQTTVDANLNCWYWPKGKKNAVKKAYAEKNNFQDIATTTYHATNLTDSTTYDYYIGNTVSTKVTGSFTTKLNWAYRKPLPDVNFIAGSCTYINQPAVDRTYTDMAKLNKPATAYGGDTTIFATMANTPAQFMLWLGDNWYTREVDYTSQWGLNNRPAKDRQHKFYQPLLKAMSHYAIWDDHDFGPNDCDASYILANESRDAFKRFWANPSYGNGTKGIYTKFTQADADFFLLDDRTWRSNDNMADSVNGAPNAHKVMFGNEQLQWLKNQLLGSNANFKFIITGSQILNPISPFDCFRKFPVEYQELIDFLQIEKIKGVLFMTGDRHHTEIIKKERVGAYPLYDITVSPLTSGTHKFSGPEKNNSARVLGIDEKQNFGHIKITGPLSNRKLSIVFKGINGEELTSWSIMANELR
jgi:alkaline phosphatase D